MTNDDLLSKSFPSPLIFNDLTSKFRFNAVQEKNRINKNGELYLTSMKTRSQLKNLEDAIQKLEIIIEEASYVPPETTLEKKAHVQKL